MLDLLAGDRNATSRHLDAYRTAAGKPLTVGSSPPAAAAEARTAPIPGPLRSFARMAAISSDSSPEEILPALARNVVTNGYQASHSNDALEQTEYLKLVHRYLTQARELDKLAGEGKVIKIENCESRQCRGAAPHSRLPHARRLRVAKSCSKPSTRRARSSLPIPDSRVNDLEQALRTNRPFTYDYHATSVPVLFGPEYWMRILEG